MFRKIMCFVVFAFIFSGIPALAADKEAAALSSATTWVEMVDGSQYSKSWKEAAEYFRRAVKPDQWSDSMKAVREPLGDVLSRSVRSQTYMTSMPGAPDGEYVIIQFDTTFENKKAAVETITPMLDKDGNWRVSGYFIR